jgi:hypothetical protein
MYSVCTQEAPVCPLNDNELPLSTTWASFPRAIACLVEYGEPWRLSWARRQYGPGTPTAKQNLAKLHHWALYGIHFVVLQG